MVVPLRGPGRGCAHSGMPEAQIHLDFCALNSSGSRASLVHGRQHGPAAGRVWDEARLGALTGGERSIHWATSRLHDHPTYNPSST
jgi:hypothetical protein